MKNLFEARLAQAARTNLTVVDGATSAPVPDFRALFEAAPGLYLVLTPDLRIVAVSDAYLKATMTTRENILGRGLFDVFPDNPDDPEATGVSNLSASLRRVLSGRVVDAMAVQKYDVRRPASEGGQFEERYWSPTNSPVFGKNGEVAYIIHRVEDVTENVRLQQLGNALRQSEETYRALFEHNPQPMWVYDRRTLKFLVVNDSAVAHYGYTKAEFLAMTLKDMRPASEIAALLNQHGTNEESRNLAGIWKHKTKKGQIIEVEIVEHRMAFGGHDASLVLVTDVSERRALEQQFRQAQKMEAVGRLAGGVAHDFNNLLGVILGYTELALLNSAVDKPTVERLGEIQNAAERAASLTRQLLAFSRQQVLQPVLLNAGTVILGVEKLLRRLIGEDIELVVRARSSTPRFEGDLAQLEQVLMNLAINARDAMPMGGKLCIENDIFDADEAYARTHANVKPGRYVVIAVSDSGEGMDAETQAHIFEPFFTTKETGKGTGLGLAMVYGIVKQSGGFIWVYSEKGQGTIFKIYFPAAASENQIAPVAGPSPALLSGTETILLVEDEDALRNTTRQFLETSGYRVLEARGAAEALKVASAQGHALDLLLTDVVMPGISGRQLAQQLARDFPKLRVIYMTGYTDDMVLHHGVLQEGVSLIQKPFTRIALLKNVREKLDRA